MRIAKVFVNIPIKSIAKAFSYRVPGDLAIEVGWRVFVPFGGRKVEGFIIEMGEGEGFIEGEDGKKVELKEIIAPVDEEAWFTPHVLEAAKWLADFYLCSLAEAMRLFMPGKSGLKISACYEANEEAGEHMILAMPRARALYDYLLKEGVRTLPELRRALPELEGLEETLASLLRYGVARRDYRARRRGGERYEKYARLLPVSEADLALASRRKKAQFALVEHLRGSEGGCLPVRELGASAATVKAAAESGFIELIKKRVYRDSYGGVKVEERRLTLTAAQEAALSEIKAALGERKYQGFLLKGVTGSGKTQVYIEAAKVTRAGSRRVVVLVPEIALTGQVVAAFQESFAGDIAVIHSRLTLAERSDAIFRVRQGEAGVVIGARSALFTPIEDVGLIVMDEEQDPSYKQDESPRYHARAVAEALARIHGAALLLGSATPSMESYYRARAGELRLLTLPERIGGRPLPQTFAVDMRAELRQGNRHIISRALRDLLVETIKKGEQAIIMLNRRGFSTFVMCRSCGEPLKCKLCGLPLVYHRSGRLLCHHCDVREEVPKTCPKCGSPYIKYFGSGTEKLEAELRELLPQARVVRMDRDTTGGKFSHREIIESFRRHEYDILLGTQMVAKGHDIPSVTAVGIISADSALNMPDFRAAERAFMLITQTAGRAGRGEVPGRVVVQTYSPDHYAVAAALAQDYEAFFREEVRLRRELFYPPVSRLVKLLFQARDEKKARAMAEEVLAAFHAAFAGAKDEVAIGPAPAVIFCLRGVYRYAVLIKTGDLAAVQRFLREEGLHLRNEVAIDIDPITML